MKNKKIKILKPSDNNEWLSIKEGTLGGSEIAAAVGLNQFFTPLDLWFLKTKQKEFGEPAMVMKRGNYLEDGYANFWADEMGHRLIKSSAPNIIYVDTEFPFLSCTPDRIFVHKNGGKRTLEVKTTSGRYDAPLNSWMIQLQWELMFTGHQYGEILWEYQHPSICFKSLEVQANKELQHKLKDFAIDWWQKYIVEGLQPDPINTNDLLNQFPKEEEGKSVEASESLSVVYTEIKQIQDSIKESNSILDKKKFEVQRFMEDAETVHFMGEKLFTWKANKNGTRVFRIN